MSNIDIDKYVDYIYENVNERTALEQLAEEASELTWAALKLIRAKGYSDNPTNISSSAAVKNLIEEIVDVTVLTAIACSKLGLTPPSNELTAAKIERWAKRLGFKAEE